MYIFLNNNTQFLETLFEFDHTLQLEILQNLDSLLFLTTAHNITLNDIITLKEEWRMELYEHHQQFPSRLGCSLQEFFAFSENDRAYAYENLTFKSLPIPPSQFFN